MSRRLFQSELSILLSAPYAYLQIITHDEARAVAVVTEIGRAAERPVFEWSETFRDETGTVSLGQFFDRIEQTMDPAIFVLKDPHHALQSPLLIRRLREMEPMLTAFGKSVVFVAPKEIQIDELSTDWTLLHMPVPGRDAIREICDVVFPQTSWPELDREGLVKGALGLTSRQALRAFHRVRIEWLQCAHQQKPFNPLEAILAEKRRLVQAVDVIDFVDLDQGLEDVGGLDELKLWLHARRDAFGDRARSFGLPSPKGLLLLGVQGCGKSLMAKVVAQYWNLPLLRLDTSSLFAGVHPPDAALRLAIRTAEAVSPSVLWVDEIEKLFESSGSGSDGQSRLLGSLLTWLQEKQEPVFFVATANRVDQMPPELMRKGRFDEIFFVDLPDRRSREQIFDIHLKRLGRSSDNFDTRGLSDRTRNFSGAEVEQVVVAGLYEAFGRDRALSQEDLEIAIQNTIPLFKTYQEDIKALREWASERTRSASRDASLLDFFGTSQGSS